jgi:hypothetical protein
MARLQQRKADLDRIQKRQGNQTHLIAYLLRALMDNDLAPHESEYYVKLLNKYVRGGNTERPLTEEQRELDPFA